jgi:allene oxide cyclase
MGARVVSHAAMDTAKEPRMIPTKTSLFTFVASALLLAPCGCDGGGDGTGPITLTVVEHADNDIVQDIGDTGDSLGDILTFANPLFDAQNTTQVGSDQGFCIRVKPGVSWECMWTAFLADGQLTVQGPFLDDGSDSELAITGGTDLYSGASGQMRLHFRNPMGTEFDFTYEIE